MLIGNSLPEYIIIRTAILGLRSITPISICYTGLVLASRLVAASHSLQKYRAPLPLEVYFYLETGFYFAVYLPLRAWLQAPAQHPTAPTKREREQVFGRILASVTDVRRYLSGWFFGAPPETLERETVKDFTSWSLFNNHVEQLDEADSDELNGYIAVLEDKLGHEFRSGQGKTECLRHTFDPVPMQHRPLLWYLIVFSIDCATHCRLLLGGFCFYRASLGVALLTFPPRPLTLLGRRQKTPGRLSYWYREHKSKTKLPMVFIHGIGIGLFAYADFVLQLATQDKHTPDDQVGIIVLEILPISARICPPALITVEMKQQITQILDSHGWKDFVLLGHSYGTAISSTILRDEALSKRVQATMLMDPICFLLSLPDVAFNFVRRKPREANERMLSYFSSQDMMVSHTLARRFFWSEYVLWKEDLDSNKPLVVTLSAKDLIVPAKEVWAYLTDNASSEQSSESDEALVDAVEWRADDREVVWFRNFDHAGIFASKGARRGVAGIARRLCKKA